MILVSLNSPYVLVTCTIISIRHLLPVSIYFCHSIYVTLGIKQTQKCNTVWLDYDFRSIFISKRYFALMFNSSHISQPFEKLLQESG